MKQIANKLKSGRGASMILALVFLLLCVMVGASVLMAAASNAGKTRSNRQEQQLYLALSCALQLVADDLTDTDTAYTGKVAYTKSQESDGAGGMITVHTFAPENSEMTGKYSGFFAPFLDQIFLADMYQQADGVTAVPPDRVDNGFAAATMQEQKFTLTVTPDTGDPLDGYTVEVDVTVSIGYRITLEARLAAAPPDYTEDLYQNYYMTTELTRQGNVPNLSIPDTGASVTAAETIDWELRWKEGQITSGYREPAGP